MTSSNLLNNLYLKLKSSHSSFTNLNTATSTPTSTPSTTYSAAFTTPALSSYASSASSLVPSPYPKQAYSEEELASALAQTQQDDEDDDEGGRRFTTFPPPTLTQQSLSHLRTQVPYAPKALRLAAAYHAFAQSRRSASTSKLETAADLACGAAQLAAWAAGSGRFNTVYARDVEGEMVGLATGTSKMNGEQRRSVDLKRDAQGVEWDVGIGSALEPNLESQSIDLLMIGSAAHLFDWSTPLSCSALYKTWAHLLRPHGTLVLLCTRPVPSSTKTTSLRALLDNAPFTAPLAPYFDAEAARLGAVSMHASLPMPWDVGGGEGWERNSRVYKVFECETGRMGGKIPKWLKKEIKKSGEVIEEGELRRKWKTSTPRGMADWLRSTTGYARYLSLHPTERSAAGIDADYAARAVRAVCALDGVGYDELIELRHPTAVLLLRRDGSVPSSAAAAATAA